MILFLELFLVAELGVQLSQDFDRDQTLAKRVCKIKILRQSHAGKQLFPFERHRILLKRASTAPAVSGRTQRERFGHATKRELDAVVSDCQGGVQFLSNLATAGVSALATR